MTSSRRPSGLNPTCAGERGKAGGFSPHWNWKVANGPAPGSQFRKLPGLVPGSIGRVDAVSCDSSAFGATANPVTFGGVPQLGSSPGPPALSTYSRFPWSARLDGNMPSEETRDCSFNRFPGRILNDEIVPSRQSPVCGPPAMCSAIVSVLTANSRFPGRSTRTAPCAPSESVGSSCTPLPPPPVATARASVSRPLSAR